jgi:hypothetical protein
MTDPIVVMSPRVVLSVADATGRAPLPQSIGGVPVWAIVQPWDQIDAVTYLDLGLGRVVVIQRIAPVVLPSGALGVLSIAWVPSSTRDGDNALFDQLTPALAQAGLLVGAWRADADFGVTQLEADTSPAAVAALAAWPSTWRRRLATDSPGTIDDSTPFVPPAPPTGGRFIASTIA